MSTWFKATIFYLTECNGSGTLLTALYFSKKHMFLLLLPIYFMGMFFISFLATYI